MKHNRQKQCCGVLTIKTLRKILVYPKVTANMSFYSVEALFATTPVSDRDHVSYVWDYPTGLFLCF